MNFLIPWLRQKTESKALCISITRLIIHSACIIKTQIKQVNSYLKSFSSSLNFFSFALSFFDVLLCSTLFCMKFFLIAFSIVLLYLRFMFIDMKTKRENGYSKNLTYINYLLRVYMAENS